MRTVEVAINDVAVDGYPDEDTRAVFYFDACWVSGWPLSRSTETDDDGFLLWEANEDVGRSGKFYGVRYWMPSISPVRLTP